MRSTGQFWIRLAFIISLSGCSANSGPSAIPRVQQGAVSQSVAGIVGARHTDCIRPLDPIGVDAPSATTADGTGNTPDDYCPAPGTPPAGPCDGGSDVCVIGNPITVPGPVAPVFPCVSLKTRDIAGHEQRECSGGGGASPIPKSATARILAAAKAFTGMNTRNLKGAPYRNECVAAFQQVLDNADLSEIANGSLGVPAVANALPNSGYVVTMTPIAGDVVILGDQDHIGIYLGNGAMISNSSMNGSFSWSDTVSTQNSFYSHGAYTPVYYHHT